MKKFIYLALIILNVGVFQLHAQSGWTRGAKGLYVQASAVHFSSNNYYNTAGVLSTQGSTFNSSGLLLYGEYGISNRFTAILDVPLVRLNSFSTTETVSGIGNIQLGLKYKLLKNFPLSFQIALDIPSNDGVNIAKAKKANDFGLVEEINIPVSDGEFNVWTTLAASRSFGKGKTYASLYSSVNFRTESFSNQFHLGAELGHLFFNKLYLIGELKIQEKLGSENSNPTASFLYGEGTTFTSFGLTTVFNATSHLKLVANYSDYSGFLVKRKNIYDGGTFSIGLALEY